MYSWLAHLGNDTLLGKQMSQHVKCSLRASLSMSIISLGIWFKRYLHFQT